jgi:hypothetical protein
MPRPTRSLTYWIPEVVAVVVMVGLLVGVIFLMGVS